MNAASLLAVTGLVLAGTGAAQAASESPFYIAADLGQGQLGRDDHRMDVRPGADTHALGWKLRFGYQFTRYVALEVAHTNFGDYDASELLFGPADQPLVGGASRAPGDFTTSAKGIGLTVIGAWPIGKHFHLLGSLGLVRREFKTLYPPFLPADGIGRRLTDGDIGTQFGAGFGFTLNHNLDIDFNWATTDNLDGEMEFRSNAADPSLLSLGVKFRL